MPPTPTESRTVLAMVVMGHAAGKVLERVLDQTPDPRDPDTMATALSTVILLGMLFGERHPALAAAILDTCRAGIDSDLPTMARIADLGAVAYAEAG